MAVINPNTYVKLVHTELTPEHQLTFSSLSAQVNYFNNLAGLVLEDFTYQRKDNVIRYPQEFDKVEKYNYVIYKNSDYDDKYYFAYISDLKYINDNMTEIKIETDVFQTWQFDFIYKKSYVERKHVTDDVAGNYTLPESLAYGEYVNNFSYHYSLGQTYYMIQTTKALNGDDLSYGWFGGLPAGCGGYVAKSDYALNSLITEFNEEELSEAIQNVYVVPAKFVTTYSDDPLYPRRF